MDKEFELKFGHCGRDKGQHYWLLKAGLPLAYVKFYELTNDSGRYLSLCDIETREGYRNLGYATLLLKLVAEHFGVAQVSHDGSYTPEGFAYISHKVKRLGEPALGASYDSMDFVQNWDKLEPLWL